MRHEDGDAAEGLTLLKPFRMHNAINYIRPNPLLLFMRSSCLTSIISWTLLRLSEGLYYQLLRLLQLEIMRHSQNLANPQLEELHWRNNKEIIKDHFNQRVTQVIKVELVHVFEWICLTIKFSVLSTNCGAVVGCAQYTFFFFFYLRIKISASKICKKQIFWMKLCISLVSEVLNAASPETSSFAEKMLRTSPAEY